MATAVNPGRLKGSDPVLVHPRWRTVHEVHGNGTACGGSRSDRDIDYEQMTRRQAQGMARTKPCQSHGCTAARRDRP